MKTILIIEDSSAVAQLMKSVLESEGYSVLVSEDGEKGIQLATDNSPDLVITDTNLPGISGLDVCKKLKESGEKAPKILVMTGSATDAGREQAHKAGADGFMEKTSDFDAMLINIEELLNEG